MPSYELSPVPDNDITDDDLQAFIDRVRDAYSAVETKSDHLGDLYSQGKLEEMNHEVDALVDQLVEENIEFQDNIRHLKELRSYRTVDKDAIKQLVARQNEIVEDIRAFVVNEAGLPDEARFNQIEQARNAIADQLSETFPEGYEPGEALEALGVIRMSDDQAEYHFPAELVPTSTNTLWETYLASVCHHVQTQRNLSRGIIDDKSAVEQADTTRTYAHNAVTKELHTILNFDENKWSRRDTRALLGKIRDYVFPTYESAISGESEVFVSSHMGHLQAASKLASHSH